MVAADDMVNSELVVGMKPGDSSVVILFQVDNFTHSLFTVCFVAQSHIYAWFTGKVSSLTYFPLEPACEDYSCLDQAVEPFKHCLDSIFMDSIDTLECDAPFMTLMTCHLQSLQGFYT